MQWIPLLHLFLHVFFFLSLFVSSVSFDIATEGLCIDDGQSGEKKKNHIHLLYYMSNLIYYNIRMVHPQYSSFSSTFY